MPTKKLSERQRKAQDSTKTAQTTKKTEDPLESAARPIQVRNSCLHCLKQLATNQRAVFVEEEVGRIFCSESCISHYFTNDVERLEKEFFEQLSSQDLNAEEREELSHLRWSTLQEPDEVWRNKKTSGDHHYTLISEFEVGTRHIWTICVCLFLRGQPSFLFLAFPTRNPAMVDAYRRGEKVTWAQTSPEKTANSKNSKQPRRKMEKTNADSGFIERDGEATDRLADPWTEEETQLARLNQERSIDDIPLKDYELYGSCLEETLEKPHEVWSSKLRDDENQLLYHFIRHYANEDPNIWFIVVARESKEDEQIEILNAFPTKDLGLVNRYRVGSQELGNTNEEVVSAKTLH